jgi:hypothetical protein
LVAVILFGLLDAPKATKCIAVGVFGGHTFAQAQFNRHLQVQAQFFIQVVFETPPAEECGETMEEGSEKFAHRLARPQHAIDHGRHAIPAFRFRHALL